MDLIMHENFVNKREGKVLLGVNYSTKKVKLVRFEFTQESLKMSLTTYGILFCQIFYGLD